MKALLENNLSELGLYKIGGIDEAGRGALVGPVVVAYVMLPPNHKIEDINDSKKLSPSKREKIAEQIYERALEVHVVSAGNGIIDKINIYSATRRCICDLANMIKITPEMLVIDGIFNFSGEYEIKIPYQLLPKADNLSENVAAASIIAKTTRDKYMVEEAHRLFPEYGFDKHKGYGTQGHVEALKKYGPCPLHRMSFTINGIKMKDIKER